MVHLIITNGPTHYMAIPQLQQLAYKLGCSRATWHRAITSLPSPPWAVPAMHLDTLCREGVLSKYSTTKHMISETLVGLVLSQCNLPLAVTSSIMGQLSKGGSPVVMEQQGPPAGGVATGGAPPGGAPPTSAADLWAGIPFPTTLPELSPAEVAASGRYGVEVIKPKEHMATVWGGIRPHMHSFFK